MSNKSLSSIMAIFLQPVSIAVIQLSFNLLNAPSSIVEFSYLAPFSVSILKSETSTQNCILKPLSISWLSNLYIRLVVILQFTSLVINEDNLYWTWSLVFNSNTPLSVLNSLLDFIKLSEVVTMQQTDNIAYKLKLRSFWQVCITELLIQSVETLYISEPTLWAFTSWCEPCLTPIVVFTKLQWLVNYS